uniref:Uncharacterized protein n=1 Tax=Rhodnius prolixus TaxID=13249 RepID=T1HE53_RHOPR
MQLIQIKPREDQVTIRCTAEGVYPKPNMTISTSDRLDKGHVHVDTLTRNGVYDIIATMTLDDKDLMSPTTFDCVLRIPEANYTVRKSAVYYPDPQPLQQRGKKFLEVAAKLDSPLFVV